MKFMTAETLNKIRRALTLGLILLIAEAAQADEPGLTSAEGDVRGSRLVASQNIGAAATGNTGGAGYSVSLAWISTQANSAKNLPVRSSVIWAFPSFRLAYSAKLSILCALAKWTL